MHLYPLTLSCRRVQDLRTFLGVSISIFSQISNTTTRQIFVRIRLKSAHRATLQPITSFFLDFTITRQLIYLLPKGVGGGRLWGGVGQEGARGYAWWERENRRVVAPQRDPLGVGSLGNWWARNGGCPGGMLPNGGPAR